MIATMTCPEPQDWQEAYVPWTPPVAPSDVSRPIEAEDDQQAIEALLREVAR